MKAIHSIVFIGIATLSYLKSAEANGDKLSVTYNINKINEYLIEKVDGADPEKNLEAVAAWLRQLMKKNQRCITLHRESNAALINVLNDIVTLASMQDPNECGRKEVAFVEEMQAKAKQDDYAHLGNGPVKKVGLLVDHYAGKYYHMCLCSRLGALVGKLRTDHLPVLKELENITHPPSDKIAVAAEYARIIRGQIQNQEITHHDFNIWLTEPCKLRNDLESVLKGRNNCLTIEDQRILDYQVALKHCEAIMKSEKEAWNNIKSLTREA